MATNLNPNAIQNASIPIEKLSSSLQSSIGAISSKQNSTDNTLQTTSKQIVGAINENKGRIDNISTLGRFLSVWSCQNGKPYTDPTEDVYPYKTGDYFIVGKLAKFPVWIKVSLTGGGEETVYFNREDEEGHMYVAYGYDAQGNPKYQIDTCVPSEVEVGATVYYNGGWQEAGTISYVCTELYVVGLKPNGSTYTGQPSTTEIFEGGDEIIPKVNDLYRYDGTNWVVLSLDNKEVAWGSIEGLLSNQTDLQGALNTKEVASNKKNTITGNETSTTYYPTTKAVANYHDSSKEDTLVWATNAEINTLIDSIL